ncbi:hypothetical protein ACHAWF_003300 [Thalassiosira exigua]
MTRIKYAVAFVVVLSAYHQLNDEDFIIKSFHSHNVSKSQSERIRTAQSAARNNTIGGERMPTKNKKDTGSYEVGKFCAFCTFSKDALCVDRVEYLMSKYKMSEKDAKQNEAVLELCKTPPPPITNAYSEEKEPFVILHAGPHKTGTTALQAFIYDMMYKNDTIFLRDNIRVPTYDELPGVFGKEGVGLNLPHCSIEKYKRDGGNMNVGMCDPMRKAFPLFLQDAYNKAQNVLIVAEDFDRKEINFKRLRFFLQPYKKVKVVVTYRRLHDWLPSYYNQIVKHYILIYARGELHYPSIVEWLDNNYDDFLLAHSVEVAERFRSYDIVKSVDILNMHDISDSIGHFFCNHLQAKAVCQVIKDGAKPSKSNIGTDHEIERLAINASLHGKISTNFHRPVNIDRAARHLQKRVKEMELTLPRICPGESMLEQILHMEMEHERNYFPEWYESLGGDQGLKEAFEAATKKKLCALDVDKISELGMMDYIYTEIH